ncbi:N-acetylglucosamine kinase [Spironucleus salmonicida]|uniref:N-acetyl-D-glucosamine kinase n=1 Tax=Spironucleus salmonicida TaxID=348837 RepID=V6LNE0_9EUKA|nr:N-acetylglucosamine kinase [Spironucleus salmonicida]|eukprot:EST42244.1 hypothetical protein SS50377_18546 [Spironucleus salmonicida]
MTDYAIGIEGGGTKTRVVIVNYAKSEIVYDKSYDIPSNHYLTSIQQVCNDFTKMVEESEREHKIINIKALGITAAGFNTVNEHVEKHFANYSQFVQSHDTSGPIQMFERQFNKKAAVVISGTGSAGFFHRQIGGLGHFLKERGCGFSAVRRAIENVCLQKDGFKSEYGSYGDLWEEFTKFFNFPGQDYQDSGILELFYGEGFKGKVASFNIIMKENHSSLVEKIYIEEFEYLASMIKALKLEQNFTDIICVGSFWRSLDSQPAAKKILFEQFKDCKFWVTKPQTAAIGAALHAVNAKWSGEPMFDVLE